MYAFSSGCRRSGPDTIDRARQPDVDWCAHTDPIAGLGYKFRAWFSPASVRAQMIRSLQSGQNEALVRAFLLAAIATLLGMGLVILVDHFAWHTATFVDLDAVRFGPYADLVGARASRRRRGTVSEFANFCFRLG